MEDPLEKIIAWLERHVRWVVVILGVGVLLVYTYQIPWPDTLLFGHPLWDWIELLIVPVFLFIGGILFNQAQKKREEVFQLQQNEIAQKIAYDRDQEQALQNYLDAMSELLLEKQLRTTDDKVVLDLARSRTLTVLRSLNNKFLDKKYHGKNRRKGSLARFLYEAQLISGKKSVISLKNANFGYAYMHNLKFYGVNFSGAYLGSANFQDCDLRESIWSDAFLPDALFNNADLSCAIFENANLAGANFLKADLSRVNFQGANLKGANLQGAILDEVNWKGAIMPDGKRHEEVI